MPARGTRNLAISLVDRVSGGDFGDHRERVRVDVANREIPCCAR
jgi:hypothetical protein